MDTSKTYVKMCGCPEIQGTWKLKQGDWAAFPMTGVISIKHIDENDDYYSTKKVKTIKKYNTWLPRQDQIQEMLQPIELHELLDICGEADGIMWKALHEYAESFEQLWLAFYMYEKHKKVWDGEKWIKEK